MPKGSMQIKSLGSSCGSVGRAVSIDTRGLRFKSSIGKIYIEQWLQSTVLKRRKVKKSEARKGPFK